MEKSTLANLETSALIAFIEVAERGSFTDAAAALNLSQPTVSQQVRRLEKFVGIKLLHRRSNKVYLSLAGEAFISHCRTGLQDIEAGIASALRTSKTTEGTVTLGITCFNAPRCLSKALKCYHQQYPDVQVQILGGIPDDLIAGLQAQTIDLAIVSLPVPIEGFRFETLYSEPLWLMANSTHPLASLESVTWKDICIHPLILPRQEKHFGIRSIVETLYSSHQSQISTVIEVSGSQPLRQLLLSDYGISFLPPSQFQKDLEDGVLTAIHPARIELKHQVAVATHPKHPPNAAAQKLLDAIRQNCLSSTSVGKFSTVRRVNMYS
ncbi:MAG: LysR family transcriptional regulator [Cyanobacteria bacterium J06560_6]